MKQSDFLVCKARDHDARNAFFRVCQGRRVPFIVVSIATKWSSVSWDHISLPAGDDDDLLTANSVGIREEMLRIFNRFSNPRSRYAISELVGSIEYLDLAAAETAAQEIFELLVGYLDRSRDDSAAVTC
jgi:hypothetical protein